MCVLYIHIKYLCTLSTKLKTIYSDEAEMYIYIGTLIASARLEIYKYIVCILHTLYCSVYIHCTRT